MSVSYPAFFMDQEEFKMDFLNGKIRTMYCKYLAAAFGSAMITSVYSIVDTAMVGQYHGPGNGGAGGAGLGRTAGFSGACADFFRGGCVHAGAGGEVYGADPVCVPAAFVQPDALGVFAQRQEPGPCHTGRAVGGGCSTCSEITSSYSPATWGSTVRGLPRPSAPAFPFW